MKEIHLWNFILRKLIENKRLILIAVVHHEKGSPGKEGFRMAVSSDGDCIGSVGGGIMEYNIINSAKEQLDRGKPVCNIEKLYHRRNSSLKKSGLICSGSQTNFTISLSSKDIVIIRKIIKSISENKPGRLIFTEKGIKFTGGIKDGKVFKFDLKNENEWKYEEATGIKNTVFIAGGGHVGLACAEIMSQLDFSVIVFDDKINSVSPDKKKSIGKIITAPFSKMGRYVKESAHTYILIVTKSFNSDKEALLQVINRKVKYIGIMGTSVKIKKIFAEAVKEGVKKEQLKKIHAPVGIDINSDTPEEIAVSIAAEIIKIKNSR